MNDRDLMVAARRVLVAVVVVLAATHGEAGAVLSERGGTGVWEVQSAESKRPARLELGLFGSYERFEFGDPQDTHLNGLRGGLTTAFGFPGGFEVSGALPVFGYYLTTGSGSSPFGESLNPRLGDVAARARWTGPFLAPGMRFGVEGEVLFATGDDREEAFPGRGSVRPFTNGENSYAGRAMLTWDGLRAGLGAPVRIHANGAYTFQGDESRYLSPRALLPLDLPMPPRNRDNDFLSLGAAVEFDLPRFTLFGELVTDQFVNDRSALKGKENRIAISPGARFWMPGGVTLAGAYSFNVSENDPSTIFDPGDAWAKNEWRVAFSMGTIYRGARARAEDAAMASSPVPGPEARPTKVAAPAEAIAPGTAPRAPVAEVARVDTAAKVQEAILERRSVQEQPLKPKPEVSEAPIGSPRAPQAPVRLPARFVDTDGDGIPDDRDECPLAAEDWDGFQDLDGCPDLDNDQDGIPDSRDQCPNDPETYNGYYDFDGCPDETPQGRAGGAGAIGGPPAVRLPKAFDASEDTTRLAPRPAPSGMRPVTPAVPAGTQAPRVPGAPPAVASESSPRLREPAGVAPSMEMRPAAAVAESRIPAADSLRLQLDLERQRRIDLESRLERSETERREALVLLTERSRMAARPLGDTVAPAGSGSDEAVRRARELEVANAEIRARLRAVEIGQQRAPAVAPDRAIASATAPPVVVAPPGPEDATAGRLVALETELRSLREAQASRTPVPVGQDPGGEAVRKRLEELQSAVDELREASRTSGIAEAEAEAALRVLDSILPLGRARVFPEIEFEPGSARLKEAGFVVLGVVADAVLGVPQSGLRLVGHTDDTGRAADNLRLSRERARAVAEGLFARGVSPAQVTVEGRGEEASLATNESVEGRRANRRVEFIRTK